MKKERKTVLEKIFRTSFDDRYLEYARRSYIVFGYRKYAKENRCAPTDRISDKEICDIFEEVGLTFFSLTNEIRLDTLARVCLKFLNVYENFGVEVYKHYLEHEAQYFLRHGWREAYLVDLELEESGEKLTSL